MPHTAFIQIADLMPGVKRRLANRADVDASSPYWIRDSIRELTNDFPFEELKDFGEEKQLTINESKYHIDDFTLGGEDLTDINFFEIFVDYPTNSVTTLILFREAAVVGPLRRYPGLPKYFTRHGHYFLIGPKPNNPYTVTMAYQRKHPFNGGDIKSLLSSQVMMPEVWYEVIEIAAALRGAIDLRLPDYITLYQQTLHGDPKGEGEVGLIKARKAQHYRDKARNAGQMVPIVQKI